MKIQNIGDPGMMRIDTTDLSDETVPSSEVLRKDGVNPMMTARASRDQRTMTIEIAETVTIIAVIHLVETADTQDESLVSAVPLTFPINPAHLQLTESVTAHLVTVGELHRLQGTEVVLLPAREIVTAPRRIRRIEGARLPQRQARVANPTVSVTIIFHT